ncbi:S-layer homology domain-containing protein [Anaerotignum lactatifermentans]|uniref:S-layer homology domain-containing protein n=1 Tax=Anaerotignum lactatifermentans TaxID=160404 RepID=UPI002673D390|nr:S-layer homology domain-containing protein [Anaerotignum lactatifermentans]
MKRKVLPCFMALSMTLTAVPNVAMAEDGSMNEAGTVVETTTETETTTGTEPAEEPAGEAGASEVVDTAEGTPVNNGATEGTVVEAVEIQPAMVVATGEVAAKNGVVKVATVDELKNAVEQAADSGVETTIQLTENIEGLKTEDIIVIPADAKIILDMNGKTISTTNDFVGRPIKNNGYLTVKGKGTIDSSMSDSDGYGAIDNYGELVIENGTFTGSVNAGGASIKNRPKAELTIRDGLFNGAPTAVYNSGKADIYGGTFDCHSCSACNGSSWGYTIQSHYNPGGDMPELNFYDGTVIGVQGAFSTSAGKTEIYDGTFETVACDKHPNGSSAYYALYVAGESGKVLCNVHGGTFKSISKVAAFIGNSNDGGDKLDAVANFYGGTFITGDNNNDVIHVDEKLGGLEISGGQYLMKDGSTKGDVSQWLAEGMTQNEDGTVVVDQENVVAIVGDKYYVSLQSAVGNIAADTKTTIKLLKDVAEDVTIPADKNIVLDLNGFTLTNVKDHTITNEGVLEVVGEGTVDNITHGRAAICNKVDATATLNGGIYTRSRENGQSAVESGGNSFYTIQNFGTMTINDNVVVNQGQDGNGKFSSMIENGWYDGKQNTEKKDATMIINGGSFSGGLNTIKNDDWGILTINDGEFKNYAQHAFFNANVATINGGTFVNEGNEAPIYTFAKWDSNYGQGILKITDGTFKNNGDEIIKVNGTNPDIEISGGDFSSKPDEKYLAEGYALVQNEDGSFGVAVPEEKIVAKVGDRAYPSLAKAVEAVVTSADKTGTVVLQKDATGSGIGLFNGQGHTGVNLTIDFGGYTYTCGDPAVGSSGTESQGFHLEKGNTVVLKNGKIAVADSSQKTIMLIQNYCDLTLEDLTLEGSAITQYIISSNYGDVVLNRVNISGAYSDLSNLVALDVMHWHGTDYEGKAPTLEVHNTSANTIQGKMDVYCYDEATHNVVQGCEDQPELTLYGGSYTADPREYLAPGYVVKENGGKFTVSKKSSGGSHSYDGYITVINPKNGTVSVSDDWADEDQKITLTITPDKGYVVDKIEIVDLEGDKIDAKKVEDEDNEYTFRMANCDVTVTVTFKEEGKTEDKEETNETEETDKTEETTTPETVAFSDVSESDWFYKGVSYVVENGMMNGVGENQFAPNAPLTREMLAVVLYNMEKQPESTGVNPFADVKADMWYTDAIVWANANGIVAGYDDSTFGLGDSITREQLAAILYRYAQMKGYDVTEKADLTGYADSAAISGYAVEAMQWANANGIVNGMTATTLAPQGTATRAQVATMLMNFCENVVTKAE